jgi:hypothetical protein
MDPWLGVLLPRIKNFTQHFYVPNNQCLQTSTPPAQQQCHRCAVGAALLIVSPGGSLMLLHAATGGGVLGSICAAAKAGEYNTVCAAAK